MASCGYQTCWSLPSVSPLCLLAAQAQCQDLRKRKNLERQILSEAVRGWERDSMLGLGPVLYMSQVHMQCGSGEVSQPSGGVVQGLVNRWQWQCTGQEISQQKVPSPVFMTKSVQ